MRPTTWLALVLVSLGGGVLGSWIGTVLLDAPPSGLPRPAAPEDGEAEMDAVSARLEALEHGLDELRQRTGSTTRRPAAESASDGAGADAADELARLHERVAALERALAELGARGADSDSTSFGVPGSEEALLAELASLGGYRDRHHPPSRARRIELREQLLDAFPDAEGAAEHLLGLANDYVGSGQPELGQAALDRHRARVAVEPWRFEPTYANTLVQQGRGDDGREAYLRVVADTSAPTRVRASAQFFHAYSLRREGRYEEACAAFEDLLASWDADLDPTVADSVNGARTQLEEIGPLRD